MPTPEHRVLQPSSRVASVVTHRRRVRRARRDAHRPRPSPENLPRHYFHPSSRRPRRHRRALRRHPARRRRRHPASPSASRGATRASPRASARVRERVDARSREKSPSSVARNFSSRACASSVREVRAAVRRRRRRVARVVPGAVPPGRPPIPSIPSIAPPRPDPIDRLYPFRSIDRSTRSFSIDRLYPTLFDRSTDQRVRTSTNNWVTTLKRINIRTHTQRPRAQPRDRGSRSVGSDRIGRGVRV